MCVPSYARVRDCSVHAIYRQLPLSQFLGVSVYYSSMQASDNSIAVCTPCQDDVLTSNPKLLPALMSELAVCIESQKSGLTSVANTIADIARKVRETVLRLFVLRSVMFAGQKGMLIKHAHVVC